MKYKGYRVEVVTAVALLTVAVLLGGHLAYIRLFVEKPLLRSLEQIAGVEKVRLSQADDRYVVTLELARVNDLAQVYRRAEELSRESLGPGNFLLKVADKRNPALENLYYRVHYYVEEALAQGNFSVAAEKIAAAAKSAGVKERFYVDEDHVYLELVQGENYLYEVRSRVTSPGRGEVGSA